MVNRKLVHLTLLATGSGISQAYLPMWKVCPGLKEFIVDKMIWGMVRFQMIKWFNGIHILGGFNRNQFGEIFKWFKYKISNEIGGDRRTILSREMSGLSFLLLNTRCINVSFRCNCWHRYSISVQKLSWVDTHLDCRCTTLDDTFLLYILGWKGVRSFFNVLRVIYWDREYYESLLEGSLEGCWVG